MAKTILFVDDDQGWRDLVATGVKGAGYDVLTAQDASEAMVKLDGVAVGLAILDLNLACLDGLKLMQFLKRKHPDVGIIIFTGTEHEGVEIMTMLQQGASYYVRKQGSLDELLEAIKSVLR